jgi:carbon storage regulator
MLAILKRFVLFRCETKFSLQNLTHKSAYFTKNMSQTTVNSKFFQKLANLWNGLRILFLQNQAFDKTSAFRKSPHSLNQGRAKMLVLSRKEGERIVIGDNITLVISKVNGNRVTIGIEAPRDVKVVRGELQESLPLQGMSELELELVPNVPKSANKPTRTSLRDFAASVLPIHRHVG